MKASYQFAIRLTTLAAMLTVAGCLDDGGTEVVDSTIDPGPPPAGNTAPTISGNPSAAVNISTQYSFTPSASDADGDTLTFLITNQPTWANFDTATGTLSGTPTLADVGTFTNISISATDGSATASLPQFAVDVTQVALGSATLSWTAPTLNEDGSALTDLAGYKIFYGTSAGSYPNEILVGTIATTTYVVDNLVPDTYYFVATSFNEGGTESGLSNMATITVN